MQIKKVITAFILFTLVLTFIPFTAIPVGAEEATVSVLVEPSLDYTVIRHFSEGLAAVSKGNKWGFIDKFGKLIIPLEYDYGEYHSDAELFSEGLAFVKKGNKWGFIDQTGKTVIPFEYDYGSPFSEGYAVVFNGDEDGNGNWRYIDKTGQEVIRTDYNYVHSFKEGLACVIVDGGGDNIRHGFIDKSGNVIFWLNVKDGYRVSNTMMMEFSDGLVLEYIDGKYGYIDKTGKVAIPFEYDKGLPFSEGLAAVSKNGKVGFIDTSGEVVIPFDYDYQDHAYRFNEGLAVVSKDGKWGFIDKSGEVVIPFAFDLAHNFNDGLAMVAKDNKLGYIDKTGKLMVYGIYDTTGSFCEGLAIVGKGGKYGILHTGGIAETAPAKSFYVYIDGTLTNLGKTLYEKDGYHYVESEVFSKAFNFPIYKSSNGLVNYFMNGTRQDKRTNIATDTGHPGDSNILTFWGIDSKYYSVTMWSEDGGGYVPWDTERLAEERGEDYTKYPYAERTSGKIYIPLELTCWMLDCAIDIDKTDIQIRTANSRWGIKPDPPSELKVQDAEVGILITWTGDDDADGYHIYRSEKKGEKGELIYEGEAKPTKFVDINVKSNRRYYYTIYKLIRPKAGDKPTETIMTFDKGTDDDGSSAVTTGTIRGSERDGKKGFLLMTVDSPTMIVNGKEQEIDPGRGTTPKIVRDRTLMPIRAAIESMNGKVDWGASEQKVSLSCSGYSVEMVINQRKFKVNGAEKELDVPPQIINERTMLPIRFVAENIGCEIAWVGSTKEIIVVYWES